MESIAVNRLVSPRSLAEAIGMSESSLKRWADRGLLQVTRTAGGHRRIALRDAIRFVRERKIKFLKPTAIGLPAEDLSVQVDSDQLDEALLQHLSEGQISAAWHLLIGHFLDGMTIAELGDGPIKAALRELGSRWEHDSDGIFIEHRATDVCIQIVQQMRLLAMPAQAAFRATGGAIRSDPYILPSMLVASVITEQGGEATNLGPNTPIDVLRIDSIQRPVDERPDMVWISTSILDDPSEISHEISEFAHECHKAGIQLVIGGRESCDLSLEHVPGLTVHGSLAGVAEQARAMANA